MAKKLSGLPFLFIFFLASEKAFAQNWQFGVKGGLSLPNLSPGAGASDVSEGYQTITGPDFGLAADYKLSNKFSIESGLEWSTQGGQKTGLQTIPAYTFLSSYFPPGTEYLYANFTTMIRLQYGMLPVLLKYSMDLGRSGRWKFYVDGGVFGGLLVTAKGSAAGSSKIYLDMAEKIPLSTIVFDFDSTGDLKSQLHKGNFGVEGNVGLLYQMNSISVFAEVGGNYGFLNLQKDSQNGVNHTGALIFRVGIFIKFKTEN